MGKEQAKSSLNPELDGPSGRSSPELLLYKYGVREVAVGSENTLFLKKTWV